MDHQWFASLCAGLAGGVLEGLNSHGGLTFGTWTTNTTGERVHTLGIIKNMLIGGAAGFATLATLAAAYQGLDANGPWQLGLTVMSFAAALAGRPLSSLIKVSTPQFGGSGSALSVAGQVSAAPQNQFDEAGESR